MRLSRLCVAISLSASLAQPAIAQESSAASFSLAGTVFEKAAHARGIEPTLLYALTLIESNDTAPDRGIQRGFVAPWPYTLRTPSTAYRFDTRDEAEAALHRLLKTTRLIDIGWGQVNWYWHKDRLESPESLLDPEYNLLYASQYLKESMQLSPNDAALGVGYYHNRKDLDLARNYGERVLAVQRNLKRLEGE